MVGLGFGLGLGLIKSSGGFPAPFVVANRPRFPFFGSSLGNQYRAQASATGGWNDQTKVYYDPDTSGGTQLMATDGAFLFRSWAENASGTQWQIDDSSDPDDPDTWVRGNAYSTRLAGLTSGAETADLAVVYQMVNDSNPLSGVTKAKYKQGLDKYWEFIQVDFVKIQRMYINIEDRQFGGSPSDANVQIVREAELEYVSENTHAVALPFKVHVDMADASHKTTAAYQGPMPILDVRAIAADTRKAIGGKRGAQVISATWETDHALFDVQHDLGTDLTVPSLSGTTIAYDNNGTVTKGSGASKVTTTRFKVDFDGVGFLTPDGNDELKVLYGAMNNLSQTSPEAIVDNYSTPYSLFPAVITPTISDPLLGSYDEDGVWSAMAFTYDMSAKAGVRTLSGSDVTDITERGGNSFTANAGYEATYEADNNGALVAPDALTAYVIDTAFTGSDAHLLFVAFYVPSTVAADGTLLGFGDATSIQTSLRTALRIDTSKNLEWWQNAASGAEELVSAMSTGWHVLCINFKDADNADFYFDSTALTGTFDPRGSPVGNLSGQTHVWMLGGAFTSGGFNGISGAKIGRLWGRAGTAHDAANDSSIASIMTWLADHHGVTLS